MVEFKSFFPSRTVQKGMPLELYYSARDRSVTFQLRVRPPLSPFPRTSSWSEADSLPLSLSFHLPRTSSLARRTRRRTAPRSSAPCASRPSRPSSWHPTSRTTTRRRPSSSRASQWAWTRRARGRSSSSSASSCSATQLSPLSSGLSLSIYLGHKRARGTGREALLFSTARR